MIYISKGNEPSGLTEYRNSTNARFDDIKGTDKNELRESLLKEQRHICAYCMRRISSETDVKVEHYAARNKDNELQYANLLAVCNGNEGQKYELQTCDTRKGNQLLAISPMKKAHMDTIVYKTDGTILSTNSEFENDLNSILNLNCKFGYLRPNRKAALDGIANQLKRLKPGESAESLLRKLKVKYEATNQKVLWEYIGIIIYDINRRLRKYS